jgi:hypothetical protein
MQTKENAAAQAQQNASKASKEHDCLEECSTLIRVPLDQIHERLVLGSGTITVASEEGVIALGCAGA